MARVARKDPKHPSFTHCEHAEFSALADLRFRSLLGSEGWSFLPPSVQRRFAKRLLPGLSVSYAGEIAACRMSVFGWGLAQLCRLIGAPLPLHRETGRAAIVTVTEDGSSGGQIWTRIYARPDAFPQVIHSAKRFTGPTGLEEYLGMGFGIALNVRASQKGITFLSDHYFLQMGRFRLRLPNWVGPGRLSIEHRDCGEGRFDFILSLHHPLLGELIHQVGRFRDQHVSALGADQ